MKEDREEWDGIRGKYVKKYAMWDSKKEDYYYVSPRGIMITIKVPELKEKGKYFLSKWASKIRRRERLINILNKIPYVNARMIE